MNIVLMAGGGGTRLWPLSRLKKPKQFLDLGSGKTLLEHTYDRARALTEPKHMYVATTKQYAEQAQTILKDIPKENMFYEPERRETGPAFAAVAVQLVERGQGDEPTIFMWSDHIYTNEAEFIKDLHTISALAEKYPQQVVIAAHTPTSAETTLGYVEVGEKLEGYKDAYQVKAFKEKPDLATAEKYLLAGRYYWNMGCVTVRPKLLLEKLREYEPELMQGIDEYAKALQEGNESKANEAYAALPKIAIDYALLERLSDIIAVTGDYGWSDVGNWRAVQEVFGLQGDHAPAGYCVHVDSKNNYIYNDCEKVVSLVGVENMIVVVTDDAMLVTTKENAHKVKDLVQKIETDGKNEYL